MAQKRKKRYTAAFVTAAAILLAALFLWNHHHSPLPLFEQTDIAMGTVVTVKTYGADRTEAALALIRDTEAEISWRLPESDAALLNESTVGTFFDLADILWECQKISEASGGAFDVTVGALSRLWDFESADAHVPDADALTNALATVGYTNVQCDTGTGFISLAEGQKIDLGAIGKGMVCNSIRDMLESENVPGAIVSVGGSVLAYGSRDCAGSPWNVAVRDPFTENGILGTVRMRSGVISTSGDYERYFTENGVRYHHLLDPHTGYPAQSGLASVSVLCENGLYSDALSTAAFVLGKEKGAALLTQFGAAGIFVGTDGEISTVGEIDFTPERAS